MNRVNALQQASCIGSYCGYKLSPQMALEASIYEGLSAGRVQSVAVKLFANVKKKLNLFITERILAH